MDLNDQSASTSSSCNNAASTAATASKASSSASSSPFNATTATTTTVKAVDTKRRTTRTKRTFLNHKSPSSFYLLSEDSSSNSIYSQNSPDMCSCDHHASRNDHSSSNGPLKRKRRLSTDSNDAKDPEIGSEQPLAKRLQTNHGIDQSSSVPSVTSSVYASPKEDDCTTQEPLSLRSSPAEELLNSPLPDSPDSPPSPDRGPRLLSPTVVHYEKGPSSMGACAANNYLGYEETVYGDDSCDDIEDDSDAYTSNTESLDSNSSASNICNHKGQRTPAQIEPCTLYENKKDMPKVVKSLDEFMASNYKCMSPAVESPLRQCPLPALSWANAADVWQLMCKRDELDSRRRSSTMLEQHPSLQPRMRAILLDWLIEVCEVYKLHRETFYLAVDFLDRYLHVARRVQKTQLQLLGITCLFVAAKVEEIYPPKIGEFAYVTDGACTDLSILQHEKILLQALDWDINTITITGWLGVYMQLNVNNRTPASFATIGNQQQQEQSSKDVDDAFIYPQFSGYEFIQTAQLLDLCTLDVGMANFPYSVLAAAAISHTFNRETALRCSGLDWQVIQPCARWLEPYFHVISTKAEYLQLNEANEQVASKHGLGHICPNIITDDSHIIQTHSTTMDMYDEVLMAQEALHVMRSRTQASPATGLRAPENLLTPPASSHKPDEYPEDDEAAVVSSGPSTSKNIANRENTIMASSSSGSSSGDK